MIRVTDTVEFAIDTGDEGRFAGSDSVGLIAVSAYSNEIDSEMS